LRHSNSNGEEDDKESKQGKPLKVKVEVSHANGEVIRTFTSKAHQGINRLNWDLRSDGVRSMPGPEEPDPDADLPAGARVPAGAYQLALTLGKDDDSVRVEISVSVVTDPRLGISAEDREANYQALLGLQNLNEQAVSAVERIVRSRDDLDTVNSLISRRDDDDDESLTALKGQITEARKSLDELEKEFRTPPDTKGIIYDAHTVSSRIGNASYYVASSMDAPTSAAGVYIEDANRALGEALEKLDGVYESEVNPLRASIEEAGIRLLSTSH